MSIPGITKDNFLRVLHEALSPSGPIQSIEHLFGREAQMREIDKALFSPGRQVFVYGDRGVGKTSLAQTAAFAHQSAEAEPLILGCSRNTTFYDLIETIARKILGLAPATKRSSTRSAKLRAIVLEVGAEEKREHTDLPKISTFSAAVELLAELASRYPSKTLVVVDEFDVLRETEKELFADLIKQLGDQKLPVQFIICGIGESLDNLLGAHASCFRYVEGVPVPRLRFDARLEIIENSSAALAVTIPEPIRFRIASISDGFPHYVHLICEKLYWKLFEDDVPVNAATRDHYLAAIRDATKGIQQQLRRAYDKATMKDNDENQFVLWAAADHANLARHREDIFRSYVSIMEYLREKPLDQTDFYRQLATLKAPSCGCILKSQSRESRNWYLFTESIIRGYVRLRAEENGIALATEHTGSDEPELGGQFHYGRPMQGWRRLYSRMPKPGESLGGWHRRHDKLRGDK